MQRSEIAFDVFLGSPDSAGRDKRAI